MAWQVSQLLSRGVYGAGILTPTLCGTGAILQETNSSRDLAREEDSAGCAACAWKLVFCEPGLLSEARGCRDSPGLAAAGIRRRGALPGSPALALLAAPAAGRAACKMSVRRGRRPARPGTRLSWLLCCSALLSPAAGYVIVSSVSWAVTNEVDEELDSASTEEAMPALLEDSGSIWQQSFPASAHKEDAHLRPRAGAARARQPPAPPGMFSYRREGGQAAGAPPGPRLFAATARFLAHASASGCLATVSAHEKVSAQRGARGGLAFRRRREAGTGTCLRPLGTGIRVHQTCPVRWLGPSTLYVMEGDGAPLSLAKSGGGSERDMDNQASCQLELGTQSPP